MRCFICLGLILISACKTTSATDDATAQYLNPIGLAVRQSCKKAAQIQTKSVQLTLGGHGSCGAASASFQDSRSSQASIALGENAELCSLTLDTSRLTPSDSQVRSVLVVNNVVVYASGNDILSSLKTQLGYYLWNSSRVSGSSMLSSSSSYRLSDAKLLELISSGTIQFSLSSWGSCQLPTVSLPVKYSYVIAS